MEGLKPGPVLNFDLVDLSPQYTQKMHELLNSNLKDTKILLNDWSQMSLKSYLLTKL